MDGDAFFLGLSAVSGGTVKSVADPSQSARYAVQVGNLATTLRLVVDHAVSLSVVVGGATFGFGTAKAADVPLAWPPADPAAIVSVSVVTTGLLCSNTYSLTVARCAPLLPLPRTQAAVLLQRP